MKRYNLIVKSRMIPADLETPVGIYLKIRDLYPESALLESSDYHTSQNSISYIGVDPIASFVVVDDAIIATYPDGSSQRIEVTGDTDVVDMLRDYIETYDIAGETSPGANGFFGYTGYDCVRYFEKSVPVHGKDSCFTGIPDMKYVLYRYIITVNHYKNQMTIYEHLSDGDESGIDEIISILHNNNMAQYSFSTTGEASSPITDEEYKVMVQRGIAHALRGDVFQIVLSRRFSQTFSGDEFNVYRALRCVNPSPYLFYFDFGSFRIFGSSPETHLRISGHDIMLVDLARNDLSRSGGRVNIKFLRQIQYYSHVIHMVSRVHATLPENTNPYRLFADTFPAGTLSGAPKVKAMQLIDMIEPHNRMIYGGCIGFIGFNGDLNQAITIRSFLSYNNTLYSQAGAGVVAHSIPENELQETNNKLGALFNAVKYAETFGH